jgi:ribosomal protein S6--L-glutamate ligase
MKIAILSRNKSLHSIRRLRQEARKLKVQCDVVDPLECQLVLNGKDSHILYRNRPLPAYDAVFPRIGASITDYGLAVVKQFETLGVFTVNGTRAIADSRNKMRSLQALTEAGIHVPATVLTRNPRGLRTAVESIGGLPVVLKLLKGTQGVGVMLINLPITLGSVHETLVELEHDAIIQQFLAEGAGRDYRAFVIGNRVVAAMQRVASPGEFRSNIHLGGEGRLVKLPKSYERAALRAAKIHGLQLAGVDLMESRSGPKVIEVNSSPGFEGIEKATGFNIAREIMKHICKEARKMKALKRSNIRKKRKR